MAVFVDRAHRYGEPHHSQDQAGWNGDRWPEWRANKAVPMATEARRDSTIRTDSRRTTPATCTSLTPGTTRSERSRQAGRFRRWPEWRARRAAATGVVLTRASFFRSGWQRPHGEHPGCGRKKLHDPEGNGGRNRDDRSRTCRSSRQQGRRRCGLTFQRASSCGDGRRRQRLRRRHLQSHHPEDHIRLSRDDVGGRCGQCRQF